MYSSLCLRNGKIRSPLNPKSVKSRSVKSRVDCITNGVRQGGIPSLLLFSVYIDQLSYSLNQIATGCCVGDDCLNHLIYGDDICCL